ncbi:uncharacterized protein SYNPCC7002_A0175-like [Oratosquilla oratoria]|uniref:uncharacterized protein SYNPCC7002_A0175-like n=1 Tax=Oratosquilla oratoria TaxID=337810 RepID=UPI003F765625
MKLAVVLPLVLGLGSAAAIVIYVCLSYNKGGNLLEMSSQVGLTKLVHLLEKVGAQSVIPKKGSYTMFAPTDEAFNALDPALRNALMDDPDLLRRSLLNHIIPGRVYSHDLVSHRQSASQDEVPVFKINMIPHKGKALQVNNVTVLAADIEANNGIIHIIDKVLVQPEVLQKPKSKPKSEGTK